MSVRSGQSISTEFTTQSPTTGAATNADSTPTGTVYLNGTANAATVTVTNVTTGLYKAVVTLPALSIGDGVALVASATVGGVAGKGKVWEDRCDVALTSTGLVTPDARALLGARAVYFVLPAGSDANDGLSPATAFALLSKACSVATAGDVILFNGTIDQGHVRVTVPAGVTLRGASRTTAVIATAFNPAEDDVQGTCVYLGDGATLESLTIRGTSSSGLFQMPLGYHTDDTPSTGVVVRDVRVTGDSDAMYFASNGVAPGRWRVYDSVFESKYDAHNLIGSDTDQEVNYHRCTFIALAPSTVSGSYTGTRTITGLVGTTRLYDCTLWAGTTSAATPETRCVSAQTFSGRSARIELHGCTMETKLPAGYAGTDYHLFTDAGATVLLTGTRYDATKVSSAGTILEYNVPAVDRMTATRAGKLDSLTFTTGNKVDTDAYVRLGAPAGASVSADVAAVKADTGTLLTRITSTLFSGITSMAKWLGAIAGKTADTATRTEINATTAGATYNETTDSQEAIRDRGDVGWTTGAGGGSGDGPGASAVTLTITSAGSPVPDADVWLTSDAGGTGVVAGTKQTDSAGKVRFLLDAGVTYYLWMQKDGVNPILGQSFIAVAD